MKGEQYSDTATDDAETFLHLYPMFCVVVFNFNFYFLCFPLYVIHSMLTLQSYNDLFNNNTTTGSNFCLVLRNIFFFSFSKGDSKCCITVP